MLFPLQRVKSTPPPQIKVCMDFKLNCIGWWDLSSREPGRYVVVIYEAFCVDATQGRMNGAPNEIRTHSCRFASLDC